MSKKKIIFIVIGTTVGVSLVLVAVTVFLLIKGDYEAMRYEYFVDFKTEEVFKDGQEYLMVSGQYYGSSLRIKNVTEERDNGDIIIRVYTTLFSENNSAFSYSVELDDSVNRILFGNEKKVIWER